MNWLSRLSLAAMLVFGFSVNADASRVNLPQTPCLDDNGDIVSGCRVYSFQAGTSTVEQLYSDKARTTVHGDFVTADSSGRFPNAYADPATCLKLEYRKSDGTTTLDTFDDVCPPADASDASEARTALGITGTAATEDIGTSGDAVPKLNTANTWSAKQTYTGDIDLSNTGTGATAAPTITLTRDSSSPAIDDELGEIVFEGEDDGDAVTEYGSIEAVIMDETDSSEDGQVQVTAILGNTKTEVLEIGSLDSSSPGTTGLNLESGKFYRAGSLLIEEFTGSAVAIDDDATTEFTHGLSCTPDVVQAWLINTTTDLGYSVGETVYLSSGIGANSDRGVVISADSSKVYVTFGVGYALVSKSDFNTALITEGNWNVNVYASCYNAE